MIFNGNQSWLLYGETVEGNPAKILAPEHWIFDIYAKYATEGYCVLICGETGEILIQGGEKIEGKTILTYVAKRMEKYANKKMPKYNFELREEKWFL